MQKDAFELRILWFCSKTHPVAPRVPSLPAPAMKLFWLGRCPECLGEACHDFSHATDVLWVPCSVECSDVRFPRSLQLDDTSKAVKMQSQMRQMPPLLISRPQRSFQVISHDTKQALQVWLWKKNQKMKSYEEKMNPKFENLSDVLRKVVFPHFWIGKMKPGVVTRPDLSGKWQMERAENLSGCCGCIGPTADFQVGDLERWTNGSSLAFRFHASDRIQLHFGEGRSCGDVQRLSSAWVSRLQTDICFRNIPCANVVCMIYALKAASFARVAQLQWLIHATPCCAVTKMSSFGLKSRFLTNPKVTQTIEQHEACGTVKITVHVFLWFLWQFCVIRSSCDSSSRCIFSWVAKPPSYRPMAQVNPPLLSPRCGSGTAQHMFLDCDSCFHFFPVIGVSLWFQLELQKYQWAARMTIQKQCVSEGQKGESI